MSDQKSKSSFFYQKLPAIFGVASTLIIGGIFAWHNFEEPKTEEKEPINFVISPKEAKEPTKIELANIILDNSLKKMLKLDSFIIVSDGYFKIKNKGITLFEVTSNTDSSVVNPFDFISQNSNNIFEYDIIINFERLVDLIKETKTSEELRDRRVLMVMTEIGDIGKADISTRAKMKKVDFNTYLKITEIDGLRNIVRDAVGLLVAEIVMTKIESYLNIWHKIPVDPKEIEEKKAELKDLEYLTLQMFNIFYVKEILPSREINGVLVYNFIKGVDLDKMRNIFIDFAIKRAGANQEEKDKIIREINQGWSEIEKIIKDMEIVLVARICKKSYLIIEKELSANIDLYKLAVLLELISQKIETEVTPDEEAEFKKLKQVAENFSVAGIINFRYNKHNAVFKILSPLVAQ